MASNPLVELQRYGQSIWYDNIRRALLETGDIKKKIEEDGLLGVTSNPTIFEKAIIGSTDYNQALRELVDQGKDVNEIYEALAIKDIQMAADLFLPVYERTNGVDGYVSLEVSPRLAHDTEGTIAEAKRLFAAVNRKNVMIKVPATPAGLPAIEQLIGLGINVNVTLIFSQEVYEKVALAYIAGLEKLSSEGKPIDRVASVASFFISRIDTAVDSALEMKIRRSNDEKEKDACYGLIGKVAIANAKLAYQKFKEIFSSERFLALKTKGAMVQRPLWASTGTKNPLYSDVYYVEELIGPDTVNTVPPATFTAFRDHGKVALTLESDIAGAQRVLANLAEVGIDLREITQNLRTEGVRLFIESFDTLMSAIESKRDAIISGILERQSANLGKYAEPVKAAIARMEKEQFIRQIWRKNAGLWKKEPEHQQIISNALGWLTVVDAMVDQADELKAFGERIKQTGFEDCALLGMGGSSLCPDVFRITFGHIDGYPRLRVLDSTDPATILSLEREINPAKTLFIVSSKSGTTTEPLCFYKYFFDKVRQIKGDRAGENFVAITDPGTLLEKIGRQQSFRRIFLNQADIGGRYSALSYFGLVPAAVMGMDIKTLTERAERVVNACERCVPTEDNPGARLGAILAEAYKDGRDKVTLITSPKIASLGAWIEQLLAESTGKEGKGLLPVDGEPLGPPEVYGNDRVFVHIRLKSSADESVEAKLRALEQAGHPVIRSVMNDPLDLGEEFFLWEMATAVAGALMGVNAFDQPNVQESKDNTRALLEEFSASGKLPEPLPTLEDDGIRLYCDDETEAKLEEAVKQSGAAVSLTSYLGAFLKQARPGDYLALLAFIQNTPTNNELLQSARAILRDRLRLATTLGYGPRYLHSTGQLHKGGGDNGIFIQITADDRDYLPIPGEPYSFGVLKLAQALGDYSALVSRRRRVVRIRLGKDIEAGLRSLVEIVEKAINL